MFLQFEGVDSFFQCWLNGDYVGMSKDSRLTAEFDVSHLVKAGKNFLAVQVMRLNPNFQPPWWPLLLRLRLLLLLLLRLQWCWWGGSLYKEVKGLSQ